MADAEEPKKGLFGWLQKKPAAPGPGLPGAPSLRPPSAQLPPIARPAPQEDAEAPDEPPTRVLVPGRAAHTGELPGLAAPPALSPEDAAAASRKRMAFIVAFMKDPEGDPDFADRPLVYRILSEERAYQQVLVGELALKLKALPPDHPDREALEARHKTAQNRQAQLFAQLKKLTGVKGKTGGTGFLQPPDGPR